MTKRGTVYSDHTPIKKVDEKTVYAVRDSENIQFDDIDIIC